MKLYVPEIGDRLKLTADWQFGLHDEYRNKTLLEHFGLAVNNCNKVYNVTIPTGTVLIVDRIYIRQGLQEWSSITFYAEGIGSGKGHFGRPKSARFWATLVDCNKLEFELESAVVDKKPPLVFSNVPEVKKMERDHTYHDSEYPEKKFFNYTFGITASKIWNAPNVFQARITATEISVCEKDELQDSGSTQFKKYRVRTWKITSDDLKYELLDIHNNPLGVEANSRSTFIKKVKEFYEKN